MKKRTNKKPKDNIGKLELISKKIRVDALKSIYNAGSGHPGGSLSVVEILVCLYFYKMRYNSRNPRWQLRDRFILSKGHACPALYPVLALAGFFPKKYLKTLRKINSPIQGHPDTRTPGIETPSGSLGNGLGIGLGMALGGKYTKKDFQVYVVLSDGEMEEGSTWEAIMASGVYKLNNLIAILDHNKRQGEDKVKKIMNFMPIAPKITVFNWEVLEVDGHNIGEMLNALDKKTEKPKFIVAHTVKGKGISFMEDVQKWHGSLAPTRDELKIALGELE